MGSYDDYDDTQGPLDGESISAEAYAIAQAQLGEYVPPAPTGPPSLEANAAGTDSVSLLLDAHRELGYAEHELLRAIREPGAMDRAQAIMDRLTVERNAAAQEASDSAWLQTPEGKRALVKEIRANAALFDSAYEDAVTYFQSEHETLGISREMVEQIDRSELVRMFHSHPLSAAEDLAANMDAIAASDAERERFRVSA